MKLNHDCVRECFLFLENHLGINVSVDPDEVIENLENKYPKDDIIYSLMKMQEGKYIIGGFSMQYAMQGPGVLMANPINAITLSGHEHLDNIRDGKVWKKVKKASSSVKGASISVLGGVAKQVITKMITNNI